MSPAVAFEDAKKFAREFSNALLGEDELGVIIRAHIFIEAELDKCLKARLKNVDALGDGLEYQMKVRIALAAGLRANLQQPLNALGKLRNKFAHRLGMTLTKEDADNFYATFSKEERDSVERSLKRIGREVSSHKDDHPKSRMVIYVLALWGALFTEQSPDDLQNLLTG
jgi:hypothetical protein